jgi:hypothetical protein
MFAGTHALSYRSRMQAREPQRKDQSQENA